MALLGESGGGGHEGSVPSTGPLVTLTFAIWRKEVLDVALCGKGTRLGRGRTRREGRRRAFLASFIKGRSKLGVVVTDYDVYEVYGQV